MSLRRRGVQHGLVVKLLEILPCRIVGDPLQGIFDFGDNRPVQWDQHVRTTFHEVSGPTTPWRWANSNPAIGEWLMDIRGKLVSDQGVDLRHAPVQWLDCCDSKTVKAKQLSACFARAGKRGETVIAVHQWPNQCHNVASCLKGIYSCIEPVDAEDLYDSAQFIDTTTGFARAVAVLDFAGKCITKVRTELKTIRSALKDGNIPRVRKNQDQMRVLLEVADNNSLAAVKRALRSLTEVTGAVVYRRELLQEMERAAHAVFVGNADTLYEAAWVVRNRVRQRGRCLPRCGVGTTLLVKGLEFDHVVVLDADGFDARNLYVALTRGAKSLTIVSRDKIITPIKRRDASSEKGCL